MSTPLLEDRVLQAETALRAETVLIVDDDQTMRELLSECLALRGYRPIAAASGAEALELLGVHHPGLVLTDVHMPGMKGLELVRRMRARDPELRVVVMSGYATLSTAIEAMKEGAVDFLAKPLDLETLLAALGRPGR